MDYTMEDGFAMGARVIKRIVAQTNFSPTSMKEELGGFGCLYLAAWVSIVAIILILGVTAALMVLGVDDIISKEILRSMTGKLAISLAMLLFGFALYGLKIVYQVAYGISEIAFGMIANWHSLVSLSRDIPPMPDYGETSLLPKLAIIGGGLYLIGRGVTNLMEGWERIRPTTMVRHNANGSASKLPTSAFEIKPIHNNSRRRRVLKRQTA